MPGDKRVCVGGLCLLVPAATWMSATCAILQGFDLWTYGITGYNYMISKVKAFALSRKAFALEGW